MSGLPVFSLAGTSVRMHAKKLKSCSLYSVSGQMVWQSR